MDGRMGKIERRGEKKGRRYGGREKILSISTGDDKLHTRKLLRTENNLGLKD